MSMAKGIPSGDDDVETDAIPARLRDPDSLPHSEPGVPGKCLSLVVSGFRKLRLKRDFRNDGPLTGRKAMFPAQIWHLALMAV